MTHAATELLLDRTRVLKHDDTFAVFDRHGDIRPFGQGSHGIYHRGTRYLSVSRLAICGQRPALLGSTVTTDNTRLTVDLANHDLCREGERIIAAETIHISRSKVLWEGACHETIKLANHGQEAARLPLELEFDADFSDIFEVRGMTRMRRGELLEPRLTDTSVTLSYRGLDGVVRHTKIEASRPPSSLSPDRFTFVAELGPRSQWTVELVYACSEATHAQVSPNFHLALRSANEQMRQRGSSRCEISSGNEQFNGWLVRSLSDLSMLTTNTPHGPFPYAGVPWFSTAFGRDGVIAAFESLWVDPELTRGVLHYLAARQATEDEPLEDAEPGKILHETRDGEMAALGEIPFGSYYGSADATPLFVMLAGAYHERTGDRNAIEALWPAIRRALAWIDDYADVDSDGFLEYARHNDRGLVQQGWKDSDDSIFHANGTLAEGPIALCEVQAYAYAARVAAAKLAVALGKSELAVQLSEQAALLRERFERHFWSGDLETYVLALDGHNKPCEVKASNAGHCLFAGIADPARARKVARTLMSESLFSGWGVRTVGTEESRYNPMSYHNGSVWPHDNAIIAAGLGRYGMRDEPLAILSGLFDASMHMDLHRMPELFCGFARRPDQGPTSYPVACAPQAWAAAAVLMLLQTVLGLTIDGNARRVSFTQPRLPPWTDWLRLRNLDVGGAKVDLFLRRAQNDVSIEVTGKHGDVDVTVLKTV